jgi:dTDP-4-dehydrorhamnose 3,5-epimerase
MAVVKGMMKIVLYDSRKESATFGEINEIMAGIHNPVLVHSPPFVYHGFKCISEDEAIVVNASTEVYNYREPDEFRLPAQTSDIPYSWERKDG